MIPAHRALYEGMTAEQLAHLAEALRRAELVPPETPARADRIIEAVEAEGLSHADVVLSVATDRSELGYQVAERLIGKAIYLCARGESGIPYTDAAGRPVPVPVGHRRGDMPGTGGAERFIRRRLRRSRRGDPRVIVEVQENPKRPGSAAHTRFALYRVGMTVEEALSAGVTRADIRWDSARGHIRLEMRR